MWSPFMWSTKLKAEYTEYIVVQNTSSYEHNLIICVLQTQKDIADFDMT